MTKQEVIELVKSGRLRGFLTPEAARYAINIEEMGTYTGIVLVNPDMKEAAYPVFNLDRAMEKLQYIDTPEETAEILAGTINRFLQTAPKSSDININGLREKLSNYNAAKPYIFMDAVSHKYNNDRPLQRWHSSYFHPPAVLPRLSLNWHFLLFRYKPAYPHNK